MKCEVDILTDDSIRLMIELIGGIEPAFTIMKECFARGKAFVTYPPFPSFGLLTAAATRRSSRRI